MKLVTALVVGSVLTLFGGVYVGYRLADTVYRRWVNIHN